MVRILPFSYNHVYKVMDYIRSLKFDVEKIKDYYVEFINKKADLKIIYWKEARIFTIKYLGTEYAVLPLTITENFYEDLIYSREPVEIKIVTPDNVRIKYGGLLFILVDIFPETSLRGAIALTMLKKERISDNPYLGESSIFINKFNSVDDINKAVEQAILEGPSIIVSLYSEIADKDYLPWIESFKKNIEL